MSADTRPAMSKSESKSKPKINRQRQHQRVSMLGRELHALMRDPWQLALVSYIPLLAVLALLWMFSAGVPRQLPVAVVDLDNSQLSRSLVRQLDANPVTQPISYANIDSAVAAMRRADVYALLVLPHGLKRDLLTGHQPTIDIRYNAQFLLVGKLLSGQLQATMGNGLSSVAAMNLLAAGVPKAQLSVTLKPLSSQITPLFNSNNNYIAFLVPPILIALLQLIAMMVFANSLNRELRWQTTAKWYELGVWRGIGAKVILYTGLVMLHGGLILSLLYLYLGMPMAGSLAVLMAAMLAMLLAVWVWVLVIFFALKDSTRVISFCTALFAPAFSYMGITFPTSEMPTLAQWWRLIMPSSHYIETHVQVVSYGLGWENLLLGLSSYGGVIVLLLPLIYLVRKGFEAEVIDSSSANTPLNATGASQASAFDADTQR